MFKVMQLCIPILRLMIGLRAGASQARAHAAFRVARVREQIDWKKPKGRAATGGDLRARSSDCCRSRSTAGSRWTWRRRLQRCRQGAEFVRPSRARTNCRFVSPASVPFRRLSRDDSRARAFSSEMDTGSRKENASQQESRASVLRTRRTRVVPPGVARGTRQRSFRRARMLVADARSDACDTAPHAGNAARSRNLSQYFATTGPPNL
jgi:hypothetical protein